MRKRPKYDRPCWRLCELQPQAARLRSAWCQLLRLLSRTADVQSCLRLRWLDTDCDRAACAGLRGLQTALVKQHEGGYMKGGALAQHGTLLWKCDGQLMTGLNALSNSGVGCKCFTEPSLETWDGHQTPTCLHLKSADQSVTKICSRQSSWKRTRACSVLVLPSLPPGGRVLLG